MFEEMGQRLGLNFDPALISQIPKDVNHKQRTTNLKATWAMLEQELEPALLDNIKTMAERYGYSTEDGCNSRVLVLECGDLSPLCSGIDLSMPQVPRQVVASKERRQVAALQILHLKDSINCKGSKKSRFSSRS